jgi:hypothetical protein
MTMFKNCNGIHREKRFGSKMARASEKKGDRVGVGPDPDAEPPLPCYPPFYWLRPFSSQAFFSL